MQVNSLLRDASSGSATDVPSAGEALKADSTLPTFAEITANWEEEFSLGFLHPPLRIHHTTTVTRILLRSMRRRRSLKYVKSLKEAMVILEDVTEYLTSENLTETANDLSKVLSNIQSTWPRRKLKASVQSKVTHFFK